MFAHNSSMSIQSHGVNSESTSFNPRLMPQPSIRVNRYLKAPNTTQIPFVLGNESIQGQPLDQFLGRQNLNVERVKVQLDPVDEIRKHIKFRDTFSNEIKYFLETNRHLIHLINSSMPIIETFFPRHRLTAELSSDPESDVKNQNIVIYIGTSLSVEETLKRLKEFDQKLGNDLYLKSGRKILIMEEFE